MCPSPVWCEWCGDEQVQPCAHCRHAICPACLTDEGQCPLCAGNNSICPDCDQEEE